MGGCEVTDPGEEVYLHYQTPTSGGWVLMDIFQVNLYPNFTYLNYPIPLAAQSPATQFRWSQPVYSCVNCDNWALDDVAIQLGCCDAGCGPYTYQWSPATDMSDPTVQNPLFYPTVTTTYAVTVTVPGTDCRQIDSVTIDVVPNFTWNLTISDDTICLFDSITLLADPDPAQAPYTYQWGMGGNLSSDTINNPGAIPPESFTYVVQMTSDAGCIHYDSVAVVVGGVSPQFVKFIGNPVVCLGDTNQILVEGCEGILEDDFEPDLDITIWDPVTTGIASGDCGSVSGVNALYFTDGIDRNATTVNLDLTIGGTVDFWLKFGTGAAPCETADFGEDVELQYLDPFAGWTTFWTAAAGGGAYAVFTFESVMIPAAAQTPNMQLRWIQQNFSGSTFDHWAIDDVVIDVPCGPFDYQWSPTVGISDPTVADPLFFPTQTTTYYITVSAQNPECQKTDSITIFVVPDFNYTVSQDDDTICENQSTNIYIDADPSGAPYQYVWTPNSSIEGSDSSSSAHVRPGETTIYTYTIVSNLGCRQQDSSLVVVDGRGPFVQLSLDNNFICPGDTVTISANISVLNCGLTTDPLNPCPPGASFAVGTVGIDTIPADVETPFRGFWTDGRIQMLYRASELFNVGLSGGTITDIAFEIAQVISTQPYQGFTIRMGCTKKKSLSEFEGGLDQVYFNASYTPFPGFNTFTLDVPYDWDGSSKHYR